MKCLEKEAEDRYPTMAALVEDLERVRAGKETEAERAADSMRHDMPVELEHPSFIEGLRPKKPWPLIAAVAIVTIAGATCLGLRSLRNRATAAAAPSVQPKPPPLASASIELPSGDLVKTIDVAMVLFPLNAHVLVDSEDLGPMPVTVKVKEGQPVKVKVVAEGYWTRKITLDGKKKRVVVGLWRKGNAPPPPERGDQEDQGDEETPATRAAASAAAEAPPAPAKEPGVKPLEPTVDQPQPAPAEKAGDAPP